MWVVVGSALVVDTIVGGDIGGVELLDMGLKGA
jgi:hypothetical protein